MFLASVVDVFPQIQQWRGGVSRRVLPVVALLVCWLGMSSDAFAACGDYVLVNGVALSRPGHEGHSPQNSGLPTQRTCQGPMCQQGHLPPAPPVKIVLDDQRSDGVMLLESISDEESIRRLSSGEVPAQARAAASDVFHPPRVG